MKKYYGVLIALIPFITGSYKSFGNWSTSEMTGYNVFNLALVGFGIYYFFKHRVTKTELFDLSKYDVAVFQIQDRIKVLTNSTDPNVTVRQVSINELSRFVDTLREKRNQNWKSQKRIDEVVQSIHDLLKSDKDLSEMSKNIHI
jgi:hypothetical protein